jgi:hypothetical protein
VRRTGRRTRDEGDNLHGLMNGIESEVMEFLKLALVMSQVKLT